jgi:ADP-ribosylglycohydrolase
VKLQDRVRGCILGGAIGDALGYQIEFVKNVKEKQVTRFNGTGIISDDTQMTLFTANALM